MNLVESSGREGWGGRFAGIYREMLKLRAEKSAARLVLVAFVFLVVNAVFAGRLIHLSQQTEITGSIRKNGNGASVTRRPDIVDRNGEILATDVKMESIFAEPRRIIDKDEAVELLTGVIPDLDPKDLREKFAKKGFVWIKREVTPKVRADVHRLGIPGIGFWPETKRVYPNGTAAAHVLGFANVDNVGIAGIEKYIDTLGLGEQAVDGKAGGRLPPVQLSIDLKVQHALRDELFQALEKYRAKAAAGTIVDVETGEVIALVSLPDYDPNNPVDALDKDRINRMTVGVFEMGSTFKALTTAMVLDVGKATINSRYDARGALRYGRHSIKDFHGKNTILALPEVFIYSSNIGTAKMALSVGVDGHKAFLRKAGQLERLITELPENAAPILPPKWGELNTVTIAFGHGLAVAPLQAVMATAALMNGGLLIKPTFLRRTVEQAREQAVRVVKPETSEVMRYVMRLNAEKGSAKRANIPGFYVGAKTGTAEKVINGRYAKGKNLTTFMAIAPADKPRYLFLTVLDEPQSVDGAGTTSGLNAAPTTGRIIERVGPMLGLEPRFEPPANPFPLAARQGWKVAQ